MKNTISILITLMVISVSVDGFAQRGKTTVYNGRKGKKAVAHTNKHGKTIVVHKGRKGNIRVHRTHRKRAKVVHHHYRHLPRRGAVVATINTAALTIRFGGVGYRLYSGVWYRPQGAKWVVVRPPLGIRVRNLPVGYRRVVIGPKTYYYFYGTYYTLNGKEYEVVEEPIGAEVYSLPEGSSSVIVNSQEYYMLDGHYYMPSVNEDGEEILVLVDPPSK